MFGEGWGGCKCKCKGGMYHTLRYHTIPYYTILYCTVTCGAVQCRVILYCTILSYPALYCGVGKGTGTGKGKSPNFRSHGSPAQAERCNARLRCVVMFPFY